MTPDARLRYMSGACPCCQRLLRMRLGHGVRHIPKHRIEGGDSSRFSEWCVGSLATTVEARGMRNVEVGRG